MPAPEKSKSLESWIWDAACSIRGAKDAPKYKDYILPLIFTKRLCDVFDDELNRIAKEVGSRKKAFQLAKAAPVLLTLVSFAVTRKAYGRITKMFIKEYEEATGRTVRFRLSFGGSGTQARAVIDGLPADISALALPLDTIKIADAGAAGEGLLASAAHRGLCSQRVV